MNVHAYRCSWLSDGWVDYYDADKLPAKWDDHPDEIAALVLKIEAEAEISRITAERDALAADARLFRLMFPDEAGRELARKTLEAVKP